MEPATHRIRRQVWRVRTGSESDAFALRSELRAALDAVLNPALEQAFAAVDSAAILRLPRIEVHVRVQQGEPLVPAVLAAVEQQVAEQLRAAAMLTADADQPVSTPVGVQREAALQQYLLTGSMPWPYAAQTPAEQTALLRAWCREDAGAAWRMAATAGSHECWYRLLQLADADEVLARLEPAAGASPLTRAALALSASAGERHAHLLAAAVLLHELVRAGPPPDTGSVAAAALGRVTANPEAERALRTALHQAGALLPSTEPRHDRRSRSVSAAPPEGEAERTALIAAESPPAVIAESTVRSAAESASDADTWVHDAGLVLLHPFIPRLLETCGIASGGALPPESRPRAAALLHYAATGSQDVCEVDVGVARILLGLDPADPLPVASGLLGEAMVQEVDAMLLAVLEHWRALGSTSAGGLRGTFLQRRGLVGARADGWLLRVETSAFDMLLERLPWGVGVVRLPWMTRTLHVEWPTR